MRLKICSIPLLWMNILHLITAAKQEPSPVLQKLQESCKTSGTCAVSFPKEELKDRLTPLQYHVTQEKGTEGKYSGQYVRHKAEGLYTCVVCGNQLFSSETKFDSGSGWPSFYDAIDKDRIKLVKDTSHGMSRVEVTCARCGAHLGHVFEDGPEPTGLRYCMNSASLDFMDKDETVYGGMQRLEAKCVDCGAHLGHVFDDGPKPNKVRYCVNSASMCFKKHTTV